jgi:uncharacterized BrkB/YihY/UPF0761 family membrane protein
LFLVLFAESSDLVLQVLVAFEHAPHNNVVVRRRFFAYLTLGAVFALQAGRLLLVTAHLLLEPCVLTNEVLVTALAFFNVE